MTEAWATVKLVMAWVKLRPHPSGFYRKAQMIHSQVRQGNPDFNARVFKIPDLYFQSANHFTADSLRETGSDL